MECVLAFILIVVRLLKYGQSDGGNVERGDDGGGNVDVGGCDVERCDVVSNSSQKYLTSDKE